MTDPARAARHVPEPDPARYAEASELAVRAPEPAVSGNVVTATAGWTDPSLTTGGLFYPRGVSSGEGRLRHYARHFSLVEVDATYYSLLPPSTAERWVQWTPDAFRFDLKAFPILTGHPIDSERLPKDLRAAVLAAGLDERRIYADHLPRALADEIEARFRALCEPLRVAGKLGCVMLQFPPWFGATRGNARRIEAVAERWSGVPLSVEFRHPSWLDPARRTRVAELLRRLRLSYVVVDEPHDATHGVPPAELVTNPELSLLRFHGHNVDGFARRGASVMERFDWLYGAAELRAWVEPVRRLQRESRTVHAIFNNCVRNYAVLGAKGLTVLLEEAGD